MSRSGQPQDLARPAPRIRRAYYDCRHGQLHLHNAIPPGGGFDELTPVICLHDAGEGGQVFLPLLAPLGAARSVYAFDLPGTGGSDPAPGVPATDAAVHAVVDFLDNMRIRQVDLVARGGAATAALRVLEQRADSVRRVVLIGAPAAQRAGSKVLVLDAAEATPEALVRLLADAG
jgi:pimeloyl-ACP methyl ester carboxylesterase